MRLNLNQLLTRAANLTWRHRSLYLYGFLLVLLGGECLRTAGETNLGGDQLNDAFTQLRRTNPDTLKTIALAIAATLTVFWIISAAIGTWALGSLLAGLDQALTEGSTSIRSAGAAGRRRFWPLFVVGLLTGLVATLMLVPTAFSVAFAYFGNQPLFYGLACLWFPFAVLVWLLVSLIATVAQLNVVLAGAGPIEAIAYSWRFLTRHAGDLLLVWAANDVGVGCVTGCATAFLILVSSIPAWIGFMINPALGLVLLVPSLVLSLAVLFARGIVAVFQKAVWLLAYQELQGESHDAIS